MGSSLCQSILRQLFRPRENAAGGRDVSGAERRMRALEDELRAEEELLRVKEKELQTRRQVGFQCFEDALKTCFHMFSHV